MNSTAEPLKGGVNACALDPPATEAPVTVAPVETLNHSTLKLKSDPAERLTVKLPPFGANARYCFPGVASVSPVEERLPFGFAVRKSIRAA